MNTPKWFPKPNNDILRLFDQTRQLERDLRVLGKKYATDINLDFPDYYEFEQLLAQSKHCFELSTEFQLKLIQLSRKSNDKTVERSPYKLLLNRKAFVIRQNLKRRQLQLLFIINRMIRLMLGVVIHAEVIVIDAALLLCTLHNESVKLYNENSNPTGCALTCSNTYSSIMSSPKKIDIGMILQTISRYRSEQCCSVLISCLLVTCKTEQRMDDNESDTSSVEVLRALTTHLSSPINIPTHQFLSRSKSAPQKQAKPGNTSCNNYITMGKMTPASDSEINDPAIKFFDNMAAINDQGEYNDEGIEGTPIHEIPSSDLDGIELLEQLIADEETNIANILLKCVRLCPSSFDKALSKLELIKWVERGSRGLWTQVGGTLEHVVLWWSQSPLSCRPANCAKHLRDWLLIMQPDDAPEPILSTLRGLGETLTVHVSGTMWDKQFRLALVTSSLPVDSEYENVEMNIENQESEGSLTGRTWSDLLCSLTTFCNSCDQNGTIPNELPIVEQIPVLHRLDHSIHTMRLWAAAKAKSLSADWNMKIFFHVVHDDVRLCLTQLQDLRFPQLGATDPLEVHIQVCVALRAKLISEVKVNVMKLKETTKECIDVLASVCRTISLATLSLSFPSAKIWQTEIVQENCNDYVNYILAQIYLPVVESTKDSEILGLILKILCESWLDHIYMKKVKFSRCGAINLLRDFDGVSEWITNCAAVPLELVERLAKHEVLRMCEGVGRLLLRKPQEVISMLPSLRLLRANDDEKAGTDEKAPLPPEMFVPNQQRWLELRARDRRAINFLCFCTGEDV